ncbi:hypothetical protein LIER_22293 [Lithospermum erythrorhizon]|uniref:RNase H type-1 domain-containing protein n=1 Tax=Lithospermum erythrorhizon TaxID=34254 RepID=A0AAV3QZ20_LITER
MRLMKATRLPIQNPLPQLVNWGERQAWHHPSVRWLKLNTGASWFKTDKRGAIGCVCRNESGNFLGARWVKLPRVASAIAAEAMALRLGLEFTYMTGWKRLGVESDSRQVIQMLTKRQQVTSGLEALVGDILHIVTRLEVKFQFTCRSSNNVAHTIAHSDSMGEMEATWLSSPPFWLSSALSHDV